MDAMLDLETGQRGYLLTGEPKYLEPYEAGRRHFEVALRNARNVFKADPVTGDQIERIAQLAQAKLTELVRTVDLRETGQVDGALAIVKTGDGKKLMDAVRDEINPLVNRLRLARADSLKKEQRNFALVSRLGSLVIVLILIIIGAAFAWLSASLRALDRLQQQRADEAMHDALTGLPNRRYFNEWIGIALAAARRRGIELLVLYFDLDGFKSVNDRFGHEAGDRVLQATAARLRATLRSSDFVARLGGDEFVAALAEPPASADLAELIDRLQRALAAAPIPEIDDGAVTASIGVARYPRDGESADALLTAADRAMYTEKEAHHATSRAAALAAAN